MVKQKKKPNSLKIKSQTARAAPVSEPGHATHLAQNKRLNRVVGQIQAIQRMISDERYCNDILIQLRAAHAALRAVELAVLRVHMRHCVTKAVNSGVVEIAESKVEELIALIDRY